MRNLLLAVAAILALNLAFGIGMAISELRERWRDRREIGALESMWQRDHRPPRRTLRTRLAGRTTAVAAAVVVLTGVAVAMPSTRNAVVSRVGDVVRELTDRPAIDEAAPPETVAPPGDGASSSTSTLPSDAPPSGGDGRDGRSGASDSAPAAPAPSAVHGPVTERPDRSPGDLPSASPAPQPEPFVTTAETVSSSAIRVSWTGVGSATGYVVQLSLEGTTDWVTVGEPAATEGETTVGELAPGTTYLVRVVATLDGGELQTTPVTSATTDPAPPAE